MDALQLISCLSAIIVTDFLAISIFNVAQCYCRHAVSLNIHMQNDVIVKNSSFNR